MKVKLHSGKTVSKGQIQAIETALGYRLSGDLKPLSDHMMELSPNRTYLRSENATTLV
jgi:hypothetical protein